MTINEEIENGMARAFFASAWADMQDENPNGVNLSGKEIMDVMPDVIDPAAIHAARTLAMDLQHSNDMRNPAVLFAYAQSLPSDGADRELTPDLFGHYLAMQAMGTGVGLESFGNAVRKAISVPYCEFGSYSLQKDY